MDRFTGYVAMGLLATLGWMAVAAPARAQVGTSLSDDAMQLPTPGETLGLLLTGAMYKDRVGSLSDPRDLCTLVKANALLNDPHMGEERFGGAFANCAHRSLRYEAALMRAGAFFGNRNVLAMSSADFCGVSQIALGRAAFEHALQEGEEIPDHDTTLSTINRQLDECAARAGEFALSGELWNDYANQTLILPYYARQRPAERGTQSEGE